MDTINVQLLICDTSNCVYQMKYNIIIQPIYESYDYFFIFGEYVAITVINKKNNIYRSDDAKR